MSENNKDNKQKPKYEKPVITTELLTAVAALCNGTTVGQRKATTGAPNFCDGAKLKS